MGGVGTRVYAHSPPFEFPKGRHPASPLKRIGLKIPIGAVFNSLESHPTYATLESSLSMMSLMKAFCVQPQGAFFIGAVEGCKA